jgi:hypothetical protein
LPKKVNPPAKIFWWKVLLVASKKSAKYMGFFSVTYKNLIVNILGNKIFSICSERDTDNHWYISSVEVFGKQMLVP